MISFKPKDAHYAISSQTISTLHHLSCLLSRTPIENKLETQYSTTEDLKPQEENAFPVLKHLNKKHNPIMTGEFLLIIVIICFFPLTNAQGTNKEKIVCKECD